MKAPNDGFWISSPIELRLCPRSILTEKYIFKLQVMSFMLVSTNPSNLGHEVDMVRYLLEWIYSGDIILPHEMESVIKLSELSETFMVDDLTNRCQEDMINHVNIDNVADILCKN